MLLQILLKEAKQWVSILVAREEEGQTLVEYALIIVLIAIVVIVALVYLGPIIGGVFNNIGDELMQHAT